MASKAPIVFVDTDICLDLLSARKPFNEAAERLFTLADLKRIRIGVSSLSFAHIDYILQSQYKRKDSRGLLARFKTLVTVLAVDDPVIDLAIASDFSDFEDAIQYYTALENKIAVIVTRNTKDYSKSSIQVMSPESFISSWQE